MAKPPATPGDIVDLSAIEKTHDADHLTTVVNTQNVKIWHLAIPTGSNIPTYEAEGEIILHCLAGRVSVSACGKPHEMNSGQLLYLKVNEPFSIEAREKTSLLATIITPKQGPNVELIGGNVP